METVREKLVNLLHQANEFHLDECRKMFTCQDCAYGGTAISCIFHHMAAYLIQNGVTIATDTNELIDWLKGEKYTCVDENSQEMTEEFENQHKWELSRNCFINKVIKHLEDAEPVKHSHWIYFRGLNGMKQCKCAECLTSYGNMDTPYCPNCGAKMDEEVE